MDRESFIESVKNQYVDEIKEAFLECEHHGGKVVDFSRLNQRLKKLSSSAKRHGIPYTEFQSLVRIILPHISDKLALTARKRVA